MRMLVVGDVPEAIDEADRLLEGAGHEIARCQERGAPSFPCRALSTSDRCPLEEAPVDVAVTVRSRGSSRPSPFEAGVTCAVRHHVPLVVAGVATSEPFSRWCSRSVDDPAEFVEACEAAGAAPATGHSAAARRAVSQVLAAHGRDDEAEATVWRRGGRLRADVTLAESCADLRSTVATRVVGSLREYDSLAAAIDVVVSTEPPAGRARA